MPRIVKLTGSVTCGEHRYIYDLDEAVGVDSQNLLSPNLAPDVMFLQFLLREAFTSLGIAPPGPTLVADGQFGPSTHYWIIYYQMIKRRASEFAADCDDDGSVIPFADFSWDRSWAIDPGRSTIFTLNYQLQRRFPNFDRLEEHPAFPAMLRGHLRMEERVYA